MIKFQTTDNPETIPQGGGQQTDTGRCSHQGKGFEINLHRPGTRSLADDQIKLEIFHPRIQDFFHIGGHTVDFVYEQQIIFLEIGYNGSKIPRAFQNRPRGAHQIDPEFRSHNLGQSGLAQTGISIQQNMIKLLPPIPGRLQINPQIGPNIVLTDKIIQGTGPDVLLWRYGRGIH